MFFAMFIDLFLVQSEFLIISRLSSSICSDFGTLFAGCTKTNKRSDAGSEFYPVIIRKLGKLNRCNLSFFILRNCKEPYDSYDLMLTQSE